ncbi:MAG TPA: TIGR01777 family oxidoreductase [Chitinophagaceae bacterium]|nr:TIGR01777 family oxidoreductase [Chitinophagaceae bacterium]HNU14672.1 TIGR01777 family oxidoreductase [Chitinophagaceae bacterium]
MATILVTGGTGLVGKALCKALQERGYDIIILTRKIKPIAQNPQLADRIRYAEWNVDAQTIDKDAIAKADYIVHLAGAGVAEKRWTKKRKKEIIDSRVKSGQLIVESLRSIPNKVKAVIAASAIGWYGADLSLNHSAEGMGSGIRKFIESDFSSDDFLGQTCKKWEENTEPVNQMGKRLVKLRIGIVLSKEGGALREFIKPLKFGVAAILGNGKQMVSWIHIDDLVSMFITSVENEHISGVYNAVAPAPVSNKELTLQLAKSRKKFYLPFYVPSFILKLILGEMSVEILKSATVSSAKIQQAGFSFRFPDIKTAIQHS